MIIALLALALAMILGGLATIFLGWDIVLVERGWTMVLAGSISAAAGAILLGIAGVISKLGRIQAQLTRLQGMQGSIFDAPGRGAPGPFMEPADAALSGAVAAGRIEPAGIRDEIEPRLPFADEERSRENAEDEAKAGPPPEVPGPVETAPPPVPRIYPDAPPSGEDEALEARVPEFLLGDRSRQDGEERRVSPEDEPRPAVEPAAEAPEEPKERDDAVADRTEEVTPAAWPEPEVDAAPAEPAEAEPENPEAAPDEPQPAAIIGTYNSGDNRYVMFSDGSIEAQTPRGVFRFKSLDELKEFIASGGEGGSTVA